MAVINKTFDKVYDKLLLKLDDKIYKYSINKKYGGKVNHNQVKMLNMITKYMENIKNSNYDYYYIDKLTEISNYLNKI